MTTGGEVLGCEVMHGKRERCARRFYTLIVRCTLAFP
jgi:hypothetical protein